MSIIFQMYTQYASKIYPEAAKFLGVKHNTLAVWASKGRYDLPFTKVGSKAMYKIEERNAFLNRRTFTQTP